LTALSGEAYARLMTRRFRWLGIASMAIALMLASQAAARPQPKAKFRIVSASGREALSFQEDGTTSTGTRCVGSTESEVRWRMTKPLTVYVFVYRYGGRPGTSLSTDRVGERYDAVPIVGQATMSRAVDYSETAGCDEEPTNCPEATAPAEPFLTGTLHGPTSVNAGIDVVHVPRGFDPSCRGYGGIAFGISPPFGNAAMHALLPQISASAWAVPRRRLLDPSRRRLHDSVTVEQPLSGSEDGADQATVSGTYTDHLAITLKRLPLASTWRPRARTSAVSRETDRRSR
jgi:hypothetical protein